MFGRQVMAGTCIVTYGSFTKDATGRGRQSLERREAAKQLQFNVGGESKNIWRINVNPKTNTNSPSNIL